MANKIPAKVRNLLKKIAAGETHRMSHDTYDYVVKNGLAFFQSWTAEKPESGWKLTEAGQAEVAPFKPVEVAYFVRGSGKGWQRKPLKTKAAFDKFMEKMEEEGAEVQFSDLEA